MNLKEETINEVIKLLQDSGLVEKPRVSCKSQSSGSVLIDSDDHKAFIDLLTAARDFISGSSLNAERYNRLGDAIIALNQFEPNENGEPRRGKGE